MYISQYYENKLRPISRSPEHPSAPRQDVVRKIARECPCLVYEAVEVLPRPRRVLDVMLLQHRKAQYVLDGHEAN